MFRTILFLSLFFSFLSAANAGIEKVSLLFSVDVNKFQISNDCSATITDNKARLIFTHKLSSTRQGLVSFYWNDYRKLYEKLIKVRPTQANFERIFPIPYDHTPIVGPSYNSFTDVPVEEFDYKYMCEKGKRKFENAKYQIRHELIIEKDNYGPSCEGICFRSTLYNLNSEFIVKFQNGDTDKRRTPSFMYRTPINEEVDYKYCAGMTIPSCPGSWD